MTLQIRDLEGAVQLEHQLALSDLVGGRAPAKRYLIVHADEPAVAAGGLETNDRLLVVRIAIEEEGLGNVFSRHARLAEATRRAVAAWGLETVALMDNERSNSLTAAC